MKDLKVAAPQCALPAPAAGLTVVPDVMGRPFPVVCPAGPELSGWTMPGEEEGTEADVAELPVVIAAEP